MKNELNHEKRRARACERLGTFDPRCVECGEDHFACLEKHHIAGVDADPLTVVMCRNCHRKLSDPQKDHPKPSGKAMTFEERVGLFLLGLADLFAALIGKMRELGLSLMARAKDDLVQSSTGKTGGAS